MSVQTEPGTDRRRQLLNAIAAQPRFPLAFLPTPLHTLPRLSERLGVQILIKRDDQTGLALGGNKARKLEFLIGDALAQGADTIVTTGGSQSNHARMAAAACRQARLDCVLALDRGLFPEPQGNLLLDELYGATVELLESAEPAVAMDAMERLAEGVRAGGGRPYVIPRGGSIPVGATGYAAFVPELMTELETESIDRAHLYLATGSTGTHSGVLAGLAALDHPLPVEGISVSRDTAQQSAKVLDLANATLKHLSVDGEVRPEHVRVDDRFRGPGYGIPTPEAMAAIRDLARDESILLDPVYTAKAMAGLLAHVREGRVAPGETVIFLHTGGAPALFAYHQEVMQAAHA